MNTYNSEPIRAKVTKFCDNTPLQYCLNNKLFLELSHAPLCMTLIFFLRCTPGVSLRYFIGIYSIFVSKEIDERIFF